MAVLYCFLSVDLIAQKISVDPGPFEPYGGKREITYNESNLPVQIKHYDAKNNLRRLVIASVDSMNRVTSIEESIFDEKKHVVRGYKRKTSYQHDLDYGGKTVYKRYDTATKTFKIVRPLMTNYRKGIITRPPDSLHLDQFYQKYTNANGIPIVSSANVPDMAILVARDIVNHMLTKRADLRNELIRRKSRVLVMGETEMETDLPERRHWKKPERDDPRLTPVERDNYDKSRGIGSMSDKQYWNQRARGMGGNEVSCGEENLLGYAGTRYFGENILVHEFSHNIMSAIEAVDTSLYAEILKAYQVAKSKGLYKNQYAINTVAEYWAEGSQWWFWSNIEFYDGLKRVQSPADLKQYDPVLYQIFERVYKDHHIPADVYYSLNLSPVR
jgi:hypothetical protein